MKQNPIRWMIYCACIFLIICVALVVPVKAITLTPVGSGSSATPVIANGDTVFLKGIATGHPREGLQVWVISKNYLKISTLSVNDDNTFKFELTSADTRNLASGQYFVVVQHPMMNGQFDVYYNAASGSVINRQLGSTTDGSTIFRMSGSGSLQGPDSAQALVNAISSQNIDDSLTTYTFTISPPATMIDPIGYHAVGDKFTISGSTNIAVNDNLMVDITSSSFKPTQKTAASGFSGANGQVTIVPGTDSYNRWSFDVDTSSFKPDEYIVRVSGITMDVTDSTTFTIVERTPATSVLSPVTTTVVPAITATLPHPATTPEKSPMPFWIIVASCAAAILAKRAGI
jgi:trimeric autotransporter adhesin